MKPLAHWAIHRQQKIRIGGRSSSEIWGQLLGPDGVARPFRFGLNTRRLSVGAGEDQQVIQLDEYGFEEPLP